MKTILILAALVAVAVAAPPSNYNQKEYQKKQVRVVKEKQSNNDGIHPYRFSFEQDDGQFRHEEGNIVQNFRESRSGDESSAIVRVEGSFGWTDPINGQSYIVKYFADETGFHAEGDHLPVAP